MLKFRTMCRKFKPKCNASGKKGRFQNCGNIFYQWRTYLIFVQASNEENGKGGPSGSGVFGNSSSKNNTSINSNTNNSKPRHRAGSSSSVPENSSLDFYSKENDEADRHATGYKNDEIWTNGSKNRLLKILERSEQFLLKNKTSELFFKSSCRVCQSV